MIPFFSLYSFLLVLNFREKSREKEKGTINRYCTRIKRKEETDKQNKGKKPRKEIIEILLLTRLRQRHPKTGSGGRRGETRVIKRRGGGRDRKRWCRYSRMVGNERREMRDREEGRRKDRRSRRGGKDALDVYKSEHN